MRTQLEDEQDLNVDMAPLIDCVFLLLIFFLVATTMKRIDKELPLELPEAAAALETAKVDDLVVLGIDTVGQLYWGMEAVPIGDLRTRLETLAGETPTQRIRIDADKKSDYEHVLHVLDMCSFYGLKNIGLHTR